LRETHKGHHQKKKEYVYVLDHRGYICSVNLLHPKRIKKWGLPQKPLQMALFCRFTNPSPPFTHYKHHFPHLRFFLKNVAVTFSPSFKTLHHETFEKSIGNNI
jgi:hypothetical protein